MTTYTPGPWEAHGIRPTEIGPDGLLTIHHDQPFDRWMVSRRYRDEQGRRCTQFVAEVVCSAPHPDEMEPNARLIAASPDLYDELFRALAVIRNPQAFETEQVANDIERVLAKVTK